VWQPRTGSRYTADAGGFMDVAVNHADALVRAGCARIA